MNLNQKIGEILKEHKEGEPFFNALDFMVRSDVDIINSFLEFVERNVIFPEYYTIILSGRFGRVLMSNVQYKSFLSKFNRVILVEGGLRKGESKATIDTSIGIKEKFIFLDDSFYSGNTRRAINITLGYLRGQAHIEKTFVVYDGSKKKDNNVLSMYRYHE